MGDLDRFLTSTGFPAYPRPAIPADLPDAHAVWRQALQDHGQPVTLVTLGPLTNLAGVLRDDPGLVRHFDGPDIPILSTDSTYPH